VKDLCIIAESFVKLGIVKPKIFNHIEKAVGPHIQELIFNSLRQLIYSAKGNPNSSLEFTNKLYARIKKIVEKDLS